MKTFKPTLVSTENHVIVIFKPWKVRFLCFKLTINKYCDYDFKLRMKGVELETESTYLGSRSNLEWWSFDSESRRDIGFLLLNLNPQHRFLGLSFFVFCLSLVWVHHYPVHGTKYIFRCGRLHPLALVDHTPAARLSSLIFLEVTIFFFQEKCILSH